MSFRWSLVVAAGALGCAPTARVTTVDPASLPRTTAEQTNYTETSRYADVVAFLDSLRALRAPLAFGSIGRTFEGRDIPYVIASRPLVTTLHAARALNRPIVYVQGNIHAGEVEGKEALQMLVRDLAFDPRPNVLDSVVLIAVPIYNADGNERVGPQERQRPEQNGPALVGQRANAQGLDLNRDYIKAEAPETRASLAMFNAWDPDVFVDLHTTDGSFHGYALTYSPPLTPAAPLGDYSREWLAVLRQRMRARHGLETFDYGNFGTDETPWQERAIYTPRVHAWTTFDHRPRYSTNYYGLRGGVAILSEAYSHDPFERRVRATYAFVREILSLAAERAGELPSLRGRHVSGPVAVSARLAPPDTGEVLVEEIVVTSDTTRSEPGVRPGLRRTGRFRAVRMPVYARFVAKHGAAEALGYWVPSRLEAVRAQLELHGLSLTLETGPRHEGTLRAEFRIDSVIVAPRRFEGHRETRIAGRHGVVRGPLPGSLFVGWSPLAAYLLDPRSDDGLVTWNFFDSEIASGRVYPVATAPLLVQ